jgi:APA family basic amino acid/polyamine antiporter
VSSIGKIGLILLFIVAGLLWGETGRLAAESNQSLSRFVLSPVFAEQLVYVSFAYSGWNTAAYFAGEFRRPDRDILRSVLIGTGIVTLLYLGLNMVFLMSDSIANLASDENRERVGHAAAISLFGETGGRLVSFLIVIGLVSTVSANLMAGPRVYEAMGNDYARLRFLTTRRANGGPVIAIILQAAVASVMVVASDLQALLGYIGLTLGVCSAVTVLGAIVLRLREPELPRPYRIWGYPLTPLVFLVLEGWMIVFAIWENPWRGVASVGTVVSGLILYALVRRSATAR